MPIGESYGRWRKADLISRLHGYEAERSVETHVMLLVSSLPSLNPDRAARAELALSLARRIDRANTPANAVPGLSKELTGILDGLSVESTAGDDFDKELRGAAGR